MKEIKKGDIIHKVREEYKLGAEFFHRDIGNYFTMMVDTSDGAIWCDCHMQGDFTTYRSSTIHNLDELGTAGGYKDGEIVYYINEIIRLLTAAGWTIL